MLTVAKVTGTAAAGYADYLEGRSQAAELGDYYLKDGQRVEAPGRWVGGAATVGCDSAVAVSGEQLRSLMAVRRPDTGTELRRVGGNGQAVAAIDATFSAPKSVSAVWALASPELRAQLERAHEQAIDLAVHYATEQVPMIRERIDTDTVIRSKPVDVIATSWRHTTARAVDGRPPDPQLHSHVLLHGAVRGDGKVVAIESRAWLVHGRELGAAYRTELARDLAHLGFEIERGTGRGGRYFEIAGVPPRLLDRWSSRHHQVRAAIAARLRAHQQVLSEIVEAGGPDARDAARRLEQLTRNGQLAPREDRRLTAATRAGKQPMRTHGDLDRRWWQTARHVEFDSYAVERLRHLGTPLTPVDGLGLLGRLTEFDATFKDREARAVALEASAGAGIEPALTALQRLRSESRVLALADGTLTTGAHRAREAQTVDAARRLAAARVAGVDERLVEQHARSLDAQLKRTGGSLSDEQRGALELACGDRQLVLIEGQAGTGKSTTLAAIAGAHQAEGRQIIATSTAALAAERLKAELAAAGIAASSYSTAALHAQIETGKLELDERTTVIHDEAALASTREQHQLLEAVEAAGTRLMMVGDPRQSQPVGAGGLWPQLEHAARANGAHVELTRNLRALDPADRRDQKLFREHQHEQALRGYHERGRVMIEDDQQRAEDRALEAAHQDRQAGERSLVIAQTSNEHLDELNARAQAIRIAHGEVSQEAVDLAGKPYQLHAGDPIRIRRTINHPELGKLRNGTTGQVIDVNNDGDRVALQLADGREAKLDREHLDRADPRLAYVQHPFPAQGQTTDTAHLIVCEHATEEGSYVALTRARERTHIYASREQLATEHEGGRAERLAAHLGRSEPELPSIHLPLAREQQISDQHREASQLSGHENQRDETSVPDYARGVLGPQPSQADPRRELWQQAAHAIEQYRSRHSIQADEPTLLGLEPPAGQFKQRYDRRQAAALMLAARQQLGLDSGRSRSLEQRVLDATELARDDYTAEQSAGWEP